MVVVFGDVLGKDNFEVVRGKGTDILIVGDIVVVVPVGELIV